MEKITSVDTLLRCSNRMFWEATHIDPRCISLIKVSVGGAFFSHSAIWGCSLGMMNDNKRLISSI